MPVTMTDEWYKQIMNDLGMSNSQSLLSKLRLVANEAVHSERKTCAAIAERVCREYADPKAGHAASQAILKR